MQGKITPYGVRMLETLDRFPEGIGERRYIMEILRGGSDYNGCSQNIQQLVDGGWIKSTKKERK